MKSRGQYVGGQIVNLCTEFLGGDLQHDGPGHQQPHPAEQGAQAHCQRARLQGQQGEHH